MDNEILLSDLKPVIAAFPATTQQVHLYGLVDLHIGAKECDMQAAYAWRASVLQDPAGYVTIMGDIINNGLKSSKTNCYEEVIPPEEQIDVAVEFLRPLKERILAWTGGNREYRTAREAGQDPSRRMAKELGLLHVYRQDVCFLRITLGTNKRHSCKSRIKQTTYLICLIHGATRLKHEKFCYTLQNVDAILSGHVHQEYTQFLTYLKYDFRNDSVVSVPGVICVYAAFLRPGGYAMRAEYQPHDRHGTTELVLHGSIKKLDVLHI